MEAFYGILIPFLGTSLGAACVFFLKKTLSDAVQRALTGFAAGVMVAASVWSLLIPAIAQSAALGRWSFLPAVLGFWVGILFLLALVRLAIRNLLSALGLSPTDRALGFIFGAARGLLIVVLLIAVGGMTELPKEAWWRNAYLAAPLETLVLASKPWLPLEMSKRIHYR